MRGPDEGRRLHHGGCRRGSDNGASEADVCGGEASAVPCLRAGCAHGGRGERGIFLGFDDQEGAGVYRLSAGARGFSVQICFFAFFGVIDIAERPEVYYRRGQVGNFIGRSRNSWRHGKRKYLSLDAHPVEARLHPSTNNGGLFDRGQVQIPSVRSRDTNLPFSDYTEYAGPAGNDPRSVTADEVSEGIVSIIEVEGPVLAKRVYDIYLRGCGIKRMGHELKSTMNKALSRTIQQGRVICEDEAGKGGFLFSIVRVKGSPAIRLRSRGPRSFEEIPLSELQVVAKYLLERESFLSGSEGHLRAVLQCFDLKRLTQHVGTTFREALGRSLPYVDEYLTSMHR